MLWHKCHARKDKAMADQNEAKTKTIGFLPMTEEGISDQGSASNLDPVTERLMAIMREKEGMRR